MPSAQTILKVPDMSAFSTYPNRLSRTYNERRTTEHCVKTNCFLLQQCHDGYFVFTAKLHMHIFKIVCICETVYANLARAGKSAHNGNYLQPEFLDCVSFLRSSCDVLVGVFPSMLQGFRSDILASVFHVQARANPRLSVMLARERGVGGRLRRQAGFAQAGFAHSPLTHPFFWGQISKGKSHNPMRPPQCYPPWSSGFRW